MLVLSVAAAGPRQMPSIVRKQPNQFSDLHELFGSTAGSV